SMPVLASEGIDYINTQPLQEENALDLKMLSMLVKSYSMAGHDTIELENKLISESNSEDLLVQAHILLATGDTDLAQELVSVQEYNESWGNDIYTTALISYVLYESNIEIGAASTALNYLWSEQNEVLYTL
ncbi:MAG: hypothetical protein ACOC1N_05905, partial [Bacillota bacterium]